MARHAARLVGKMLANVEEMEPNFNFKRIDVGPDMIKLSEDVVNDLSRDQKLLYKRCCAVRSGVLTREVALCKSGQICHSRGVTTAEIFIKFAIATLVWRASFCRD